MRGIRGLFQWAHTEWLLVQRRQFVELEKQQQLVLRVNQFLGQPDVSLQCEVAQIYLQIDLGAVGNFLQKVLVQTCFAPVQDEVQNLGLLSDRQIVPNAAQKECLDRRQCWGL